VQQLLASIAQQSLLVHSILAAGRQVGANERTTVDLKDRNGLGRHGREAGDRLAAVMDRRVFAVLAQNHADGILVSDESENMTNGRAINWLRRVSCQRSTHSEVMSKTGATLALMGPLQRRRAITGTFIRRL
jgi:hypothetical protein